MPIGGRSHRRATSWWWKLTARPRGSTTSFPSSSRSRPKARRPCLRNVWTTFRRRRPLETPLPSPPSSIPLSSKPAPRPPCRALVPRGRDQAGQSFVLCRVRRGKSLHDRSLKISKRRKDTPSPRIRTPAASATATGLVTECRVQSTGPIDRSIAVRASGLRPILPCFPC